MIWAMLLPAILIAYVKTGYFEKNKKIIEEYEAKEDQPYRTGFHFQPPKNWMNGIYFFNYLIFLSHSIFLLIVSDYFFVIFQFSLLVQILILFV